MKKLLFQKKWYPFYSCGIILFFFQSLKNNTGFMDFFTTYITGLYKRILGTIFDFLPFSVMEVSLCLSLIFLSLFLVVSIYKITKQEKGMRLKMILSLFRILCTIAITLYTGITLLWGANYYTTPMETQLGIETQEISLDELTAVTALFAEKANEKSSLITRDESLVFDEDLDTIFDQSRTLYDSIEEKYDALNGPSLSAKPMLFSKWMSQTNYTGIFFPFTGEANVNVDAPSCFLPSTIAHELAHVRGVAPEQTANFIAILACEASHIASYEYSGALLGYLHLSNALYSADKNAWQTISDSLNEEVRADLDFNNTYWEKFRSPIANAADHAYDNFLQSFDQELGVKSYGAVVDLLVVYFKDGLF